MLDYLKSNQGDGKPFFAYLSFQVAHTPFMSPHELIDKYDKIYSVGWDKIREQRFEKQKELGFWPSDMTIPTRLPPNVAWDSLSQDQKNYAARAIHTSYRQYSRAILQRHRLGTSHRSIQVLLPNHGD
jgi:arylsulfatase A-like enzyme